MASPAVPSIHCLPDDVLSLVFAQAVHDEFEHNSALDLKSEKHGKSTIGPFQYVALSVCRRWYHLVVSSPLLWTRICTPVVDQTRTVGRGSTKAASIARIFLQRSMSSPVTLVVHPNSKERPQYSGSRKEPYEDLVLLTESNAARFQSFTIPGSIYTSLFATSCPLSEVQSPASLPHFPNIKHLSVISNEEDPCEIVHDHGKPHSGSISHQYPVAALQSLDFRGYCFLCTPIPYDIFPSLTKLHLDPIMPTRSVLSGIFTNCPSLNTLILAIEGSRFPLRTRLVPTIPGANPQTHPLLISPPTLRRLAIHFRFPQGAYCSCALSQMVTPNLEYLEISGCMHPSEPHCAAVLGRLTSSPLLRRVKIHSDYFPSPRWLTTFERVDWVTVFTDIVSFEDGVGVDVEIISLDSPTWLQAGFLPSILQAPRIRSLIIRATSGFIKRQVIQAGKPAMSTGKETFVPLAVQMVEVGREELVLCADALRRYLQPLTNVENGLILSVERRPSRIGSDDLLDRNTLQRVHGGCD